MELMKLPVISYDEEAFEQQLIQDPRIQSTLASFGLSEQAIKNNLSVLSQYQRLLDNELPMGKLKDYIPILVCENEILSISYKLNEQQSELRRKTAHSKNFLINHLSLQQLMIDKSKIMLDHYRDLSVIKRLLNLSSIDTVGYYVYGDYGIGKTYLLAAISNKMAKEGYSVCFVNMNRLTKEIKQSFADKSSSFDELLSKAMTADFLVLDDIGNERATSWSRDEVLFPILDYRMEQQKLTCFSSNLSLDKLREFYLSVGDIVDEIKVDRLMERIEVLSDSLLIESKTKSLRRR